jgi:hypothetical protein
MQSNGLKKVAAAISPTSAKWNKTHIDRTAGQLQLGHRTLEGKIEFENIDARLAENAEIAPHDVIVD